MKKGFTLIELLLVMIILGLLATLVFGNFLTSLKKGRDAQRKADLENVQKALELYYEDSKAYPLTGQLIFGQSLCHPAGCDTKMYISKVPNDPTSNPNFEYLSDGTKFSLYACLENNQQILPYVSTGYSSMASCPTMCKDTSGASVRCVWGISSTNTNP